MKDISVELCGGGEVIGLATDVSVACEQNCSRLQARLAEVHESIAGSHSDIKRGRLEVRPGFLRCVSEGPLHDTCQLVGEKTVLHYRTAEERAALDKDVPTVEAIEPL